MFNLLLQFGMVRKMRFPIDMDCFFCYDVVVKKNKILFELEIKSAQIILADGC